MEPNLSVQCILLAILVTTLIITGISYLWEFLKCFKSSFFISMYGVAYKSGTLVGFGQYKNNKDYLI